MELLKTTHQCLNEKLWLIPSTKLLIQGLVFRSSAIIPQETLTVDFCGKKGLVLGIMLEVLEKRWKNLDLLSVLREVQRTVPTRTISEDELYRGTFRYPHGSLDLFENLSCLPRLQMKEQNSVPGNL